MLLFSFPLQAACRCSCNAQDGRICASYYDIDHPCIGLCPPSSPQATSTVPIRTACPLTQVYNPNTGINEWKVVCDDD